MKNSLIAKLYAFFLSFSLLSFAGFSQVNINVTGGGYPTGTSMMGITYGNGVYVAVGYTGYIVKSTDGVNWSTAATSSFLSTTYSEVGFGNGLFVAVSTSGNIVTSPDGTTWTQRTSGTTNNLTEILYEGGKFYIVGDKNTVLSSADGITWSSISIGAGSNDYLASIFYASGKFYIGVRDALNNSRCYSSTTGASGSWTSVLINSNGGLNRLQYLNGRFFAFNSTPSVWTSTDGASWSAHPSARIAASNQIFHGIHDGTNYYLFGSSPEHTYTSVFTSSDGLTFSLQAQKTTLTVQGAAYLNGKYFLVGNEGIVTSTNGSNWAFLSSNLNAVAYSGTRYVAVGQNTSNEGAILTSANYSSWTATQPGVIKVLNGVTYGNGKFVAVGSTGTPAHSTYAVSTDDGLTWTTGSTLITETLRSVAYGNNLFVAVGLNGRIAFSEDGIGWTAADYTLGVHLYGVSFINNYFVAVGGSVSNGGAAVIKYSTDGMAWTTLNPGIVGHFHSVAYGGGTYMLVGRDNTLGVQKFFSVSTTDITSLAAYGTTQTISTPQGELGAAGYGSVAYNNSNFVAVANLKLTPFSAYVLTSSNASTWTATAAGTNSRLRSIIPVGSSFKSVGSSPSAYMGVSLGMTLPLNLRTFTGREAGNTTVLDWKTSQELNSDRFEIERSSDGRAFYFIGEVKAKNLSGEHAYQYSDAVNQRGIRYYRLKMIDNDNKFVNSQVIRLGTNGKKGSISVYPNPVTDQFTVTLPGSSPAILRILNTTGEKMMQISLVNTSTPVNIQTLPTGHYLVQVVQDGKTYTEKLVKK